MRKFAVWILIASTGLTGCVTPSNVQPTVTIEPSNTTVLPPVITPAANPVNIAPANATQSITVTPPASPVIVPNTTVTTAPAVAAIYVWAVESGREYGLPPPGGWERPPTPSPFPESVRGSFMQGTRIFLGVSINKQYAGNITFSRFTIFDLKKGVESDLSFLARDTGPFEPGTQLFPGISNPWTVPNETGIYQIRLYSGNLLQASVKFEVIPAYVNPGAAPNTTTNATTSVQTTVPAVANAMVQVWSINSTDNASKKLQSFGLVVGNGSQIITFLDYEKYTPGRLEILTQNQTRYSANVQAIDPRTGITLLKLNSTDKLPAVTLSNTSLPPVGQQVRIWGWKGPDYLLVENMTLSVTPYGAPGPAFFNIERNYNENIMGGIISFPGAVVTDNENNVLGIETAGYNNLIIHLYPLGWMPPIAAISSGIDLLAPEAADLPWAGGPVISVLANNSSIRGYYGGLLTTSENYEKMTVSVQNLLGTLGGNVSTSDLNLSRHDLSFWYKSLDSSLLILVYPTPVDLKNNEGKLLAQAKWIAIQWGRANGQPNRLIYGSIPYITEGGFVIQGNITALQQAIYPP